jgi:hypothetical protein
MLTTEIHKIDMSSGQYFVSEIARWYFVPGACSRKRPVMVPVDLQYTVELLCSIGTPWKIDMLP